MSSTKTLGRTSPWPHRAAVVLACATFPLIWLGGLVTTRDAGMAVPDWPSTYGYNMFLYPWQSWVSGPWDLFIEHGHRLLGATVGLLTIALCVAAWRWEARRWMRIATIVALAAVIFQGALGGMRVRLDERWLAMVHGCFGPAFFAFAATLAVMTSRGWAAVDRRTVGRREAGVQRFALTMAVLAYAQLVVGASIRHLPRGFTPETFRTTVFAHLFLAAVLVGTAVALVLNVARFHRVSRSLSRGAIALGALLLVQPLLGAATWVTNYGWPAWVADHTTTETVTSGYVVTAHGFWQALITTAHQATGSLVLAVSVVMAVCACREVRSERPYAAFRSVRLEALA